MYRFKITWIKWKKGTKFHFPFPPPFFFHFPVDLHTLQCATSATPEMIKKTLKNDLEHDDVLIYSGAARSTHVKIGPPFNYFTLWAP